ncbi:MAG: twin-arginine translocase subunit TatC [bacterium]|nr:twin-arginine translocase subunit TatC [bacterium]
MTDFPDDKKTDGNNSDDNNPGKKNPGDDLYDLNPDESPEDQTGPRDQLGFDGLKPNKDHPLSEPGSQESDSDPSPSDDVMDSDIQKELEEDLVESRGEKNLTFVDHLEDLRKTLIQSLIAGLAATIICWFISADLLDLLVNPIKDQGVYFTAPNEAFLVRLKLAAALGLFVVAPFIFFRIYMFIMPGLYSKEKKVITPLLLVTTLLFYTGVSFGFLVVIPQVILFMMSFGTAYLSPLIGVGSYFDFVSKLCLAFGLVFQLPLLVLFLSWIGIIKPKTLLRTWRYAILAIFGLSALLTPPDVISQVMMAGPVLLLYWSSVLVALVVTKKRGKED